MNDETRLEIERHFDGEDAGEARSELPDRLEDDPEARRHLELLIKLRDLARRHDPASRLPARRPSLPAAPRPIARWLAIASAAAAILILSRVVGPWWVRPPAAPLASGGLVPASLSGRLASPGDRPPLEVELYRWANAPGRASGQAARLVLALGSPSRKRSPADEILALELANEAGPSPRRPRGDVRRFAASRGPKATLPARSPTPGPRPRLSPPTA